MNSDVGGEQNMFWFLFKFKSFNKKEGGGALGLNDVI